MNKALRISFAALALLLLPLLASAQQNTLTQTTVSAAVANDSQLTITVASATGITAGNTMLYIEREAFDVRAVNGLVLTVVRGYDSTVATGHINGSVVLAGRYGWFYHFDPPAGSCTAANTLVTPYVNTKSGYQWLCSTVTSQWVPGWGNNDRAIGPTAAVASAAGQVTPSGQLFHITGALAITGFLLPIGFREGTFCVIPDGTFTTTTANNIALASTAVVSKTMCFSYDTNTSKFYPSY